MTEVNNTYLSYCVNLRVIHFSGLIVTSRFASSFEREDTSGANVEETLTGLI